MFEGSLMKVWMLAGAVSLCAIAEVSAADMYAPAPGGYQDVPIIQPNIWAGFYGGLTAGYAFSNSNDISYYFHDPVLLTTSQTYRFDKLNQEGGFVGTLGGYNWQSGPFVYGVETDFQAGNISGSTSNINPFNTWDTYGYKSQLDWWGTLRGRLGYSFGQALVYATGGVAYGQVQSQVTYTSVYPQHCCGAPAGTVAFGRNNKTENDVGFVVGGGLEYALSPRWSIKGEYQYIDLGTTDTATNYCFSGCTTNELHAKVENAFNIVTLGINYRMGIDYVPLK